MENKVEIKLFIFLEMSHLDWDKPRRKSGNLRWDGESISLDEIFNKIK